MIENQHTEVDERDVQTLVELTQIEKFLDNLTHQQKVELAFQLMDYIATEMYLSGDTITIVTKEK